MNVKDIGKVMNRGVLIERNVCECRKFECNCRLKVNFREENMNMMIDGIYFQRSCERNRYEEFIEQIWFLLNQENSREWNIYSVRVQRRKSF